MKASTERKVIRWIHIILSMPILWFIYGPVAETQKAAGAMKFVFIPVVIISGFWLWLGAKIKKGLTKKMEKSAYAK